MWKQCNMFLQKQPAGFISWCVYQSMQKQIGFYSSQLISSHTHTLPPKKHLQYQCHTKEWSAQGLGKRSRTGEVTMNKDQEKVFLTLPWIPSLLFSLHLSLMCENINIRYAPQSDQQQLPPCFQLCAFFHCLTPCSQDSISGTTKRKKVPKTTNSSFESSTPPIWMTVHDDAGNALHMRVALLCTETHHTMHLIPLFQQEG